MPGKSKGRAFLISISDGAGGFQPFAGLTGKSLSIGTERIDVTTPHATLPEGSLWRETLDGTKAIDLSGDGKVVDEASEKRAVALAMGVESEDTFRVNHPTLGSWEGMFSFDIELGDDGSATFSMSLQSNGEIVYTAPA